MVTATAIKLSINDKKVRTFHHNGTVFTDLDLRYLTKKEKNKLHILYLCSELVVCLFFHWFARVPEDNLGLRSKVFLRFLSVNPWINLSSLRFVMTLEEEIGTNTQLQEQQCLTEDVQMR